jgi:hypothetical protein
MEPPTDQRTLDVHLATVSDSLPTTGRLQEWNAAYYRLEDYLRAHLVVSKIHQHRIVLRLLDRAAARHRQDPTQSPVRLAMEEAYAEIERWFQRVMQNDEIPPARLATMGRVSMYILEATQRWPAAFLADDPPPEFVQAMHRISIRSGPDLRVSTMVPREPDITPESEPEHASAASSDSLALF